MVTEKNETYLYKNISDEIEMIYCISANIKIASIHDNFGNAILYYIDKFNKLFEITTKEDWSFKEIQGIRAIDIIIDENVLYIKGRIIN